MLLTFERLKTLGVELAKNRSLEKTNARLLEDISKRVDAALERNPVEKPVVLEVGNGNGVTSHELALNPKYSGKVHFIAVNHNLEAGLSEERLRLLKRKARNAKKSVKTFITGKDFHDSALNEFFNHTVKKPVVENP